MPYAGKVVSVKVRVPGKGDEEFGLTGTYGYPVRGTRQNKPTTTSTFPYTGDFTMSQKLQGTADVLFG